MPFIKEEWSFMVFNDLPVFKQKISNLLSLVPTNKYSLNKQFNARIGASFSGMKRRKYCKSSNLQILIDLSEQHNNKFNSKTIGWNAKVMNSLFNQMFSNSIKVLGKKIKDYFYIFYPYF